MRHAVFSAIFGLSLAWFSSADGEENRLRDISVKIPPRAFAYSVGDVVLMEVDLKVGKEFELDRSTLPTGRTKLNDWLELAIVKLVEQKQESENRYSIALSYQIFSIPKETIELVIPDYPLKFASQKSTFVVFVPEYRLTLSALTTLEERKRRELVPDLVPTKPDLSRAAAAGLSSLAILGAITWLIYFPRLKELISARKRSPFLKALAEIKKAGFEKEAMAIVHHALNGYAGRVCFGHELDAFLNKHHLFRECASDLRGFFARSDQLFFTDSEQPAEIDSQQAIAQLRMLLDKLRKAEHETNLAHQQERRRER